jgi:hypothetical protein
MAGPIFQAAGRRPLASETLGTPATASYSNGAALAAPRVLATAPRSSVLRTLWSGVPGARGRWPGPGRRRHAKQCCRPCGFLRRRPPATGLLLAGETAPGPRQRVRGWPEQRCFLPRRCSSRRGRRLNLQAPRRGPSARIGASGGPRFYSYTNNAPTSRLFGTSRAPGRPGAAWPPIAGAFVGVLGPATALDLAPVP